MLSKRLKTIASLVDTKSIVDVGCDHALLCMYLTNKRIKCRGTDISEKVINNAHLNLEKHQLEDKIELILTNGINDVDIKKDDTIIIAGMGTNTILNILKDFKGDNKLIISSNNDLETLRKEIVKKGYFISDEQVVYERKHYYVIIKFEKGIKKYNKYHYILGPISCNNKEYMTYLLAKYQKILDNLPKKYIFKKMQIKKCINKIKKLSN